MLKELTKKYIEAFDSKNLDKCAELFADDFALEDPVVKIIKGKVEVLKEYLILVLDWILVLKIFIKMVKQLL